MKTKSLPSTILGVWTAAVFCTLNASAAERFAITIDAPLNGRVEVQPALPADGHYAEGTVLTLRAIPNPGFTVDSTYYSVLGRWGAMYYESMEAENKIVVDREKRIGASFIESKDVEGLTVRQNIVYAQPGVKPLKYDVFSPKGAQGLPIIVIIHGGGWMTNTEDIMRGLARELARDGKFVVCSIDYRWAAKMDGDAKNNTMANLVEDVFGAIVHIREHASEYGGDASRIGLTGDSAGGHLSAAGSLMVERIGTGGFGKTPGVFEFHPTYVPAGKTVEQVKGELMSSIKAAAPSYGVFGGPFINPHSEDPAADASWTAALSPVLAIPSAQVRAVPQYLTRGTRDNLISDAMVAEFMTALVEAGQRVEYVQVGGAGHAFFDWKPDAQTKDTFKQYGVYYAAQMKAFFESTLAP